MGLAGKSVVVTGASGNLGRVVCARLAQEGARVVPFVHTKRSPGVRANCVAPGVMRTPQNERAMPGVGSARWVKLEEVAEAIAFLCDPRSQAVNGAVVTLPSF